MSLDNKSDSKISEEKIEEEGLVVEEIKKVVEDIKKINAEYNYFTEICEKDMLLQMHSLENKRNKNNENGNNDDDENNKNKAESNSKKLTGLFVSVKDNICVKNVQSTAGSAILRGYKPLFDATVIERLKKEGAIIIGKTSMDEFGFGSFNKNTGIGIEIPKNPIDKTRVTGGSSGGAAGITKLASFSHIAIAESTGGSIECPASFCGVIGYCPTYGTVSRYGLISYADSLDKIGIMSNEVSQIKPVLEIISGQDEKDPTSLKQNINFEVPNRRLKVGVIKESIEKGISPEVIEAFNIIIKKLQNEGYEISYVDMPFTFKYGIASYYVIACCEASTNLAKFSGLRYGEHLSVRNKSFNEYFTEIRSKYFNEESKRRIMIGTFARMSGYRSAYYIKATKIRTKIIHEYKKLFENFDVLLSPTMPIVAPKIEDVQKLTPLENYMMDILTVGPNLAGIPHASIPINGGNELPIGMMVMTDHFEEGKLLKMLEEIERLS